MINDETKYYFRNVCRMHLASTISEVSPYLSDDDLIREVCERIEVYLERVYWTKFDNWFIETYLDKVDKIRTVILIFQTELLKEEDEDI